MAILLTMLVVALAALLVLLACFRGFSRALKYKKVSGTFLRVEETAKRRKDWSKPRPHRLQRAVGPVRRKDLSGVSGGAVALVDLAIVLASRDPASSARQVAGRR